MLPVSDISFLGESQITHRIFKPWWDILMDYIIYSLMILSVIGGADLLFPNVVLCLPMEQFGEGDDLAQRVSVAADAMKVYLESAQREMNPDLKPPNTNLDLQQFYYINHVCYEKAFPWFSRYFPYVVLIHSIVLLVSNNLWFQFPKTSAKIELLVSVLEKCFESPWTIKALSKKSGKKESNGIQNRLSVLARNRFSVNLQKDTDNPSAPSNQVSAKNPTSKVPVHFNKTAGVQAKALFVRARRIHAYIERWDFIYKFYVGQSMFKALMFIVPLLLTSAMLDNVSLISICKPKIRNLTGYSRFYCIHNYAFLTKSLMVTYIVLIGVYGLIGIYVLFWIFQRNLKKYSFEKVREETGFKDIPNVKNDFAFLLHIIDLYNRLYATRFAIFLSEVSENELLEMNLNEEWNYEKLQQHVSRNSNGKMELHLSMLCGIPKTVFELGYLEAVKLELIANAKFPTSVIQMTSLVELYLYNSLSQVEGIALNFFSENLQVLSLRFTESNEFPLWIYSLKNLTQLYLCGNLNPESKQLITVESMKEMKCLKILSIKGNLSKVPWTVADVATSLLKLVIESNGIKLASLNHLRKLSNLSELELQNCGLERIPQVVFSLTNLQKLDLKSNNICTIEAIVSFQYLKELTCLKLWHNSIVLIPDSINILKNLKELFLSHNKLETLPVALFELSNLKQLDVSYNLITLLPKEIEKLKSLQYFSIQENKVALLPLQLFKCVNLQKLNLGQNMLTSVPAEVGQLTHLTYLELKGNHLKSLPPKISNCHSLKKQNLIVEDSLFKSLPYDIQEML
uniref:LRRC8 pannexin-like TM region domain-containing protein n=2 Tax=Latimeria chalumnae TaxID=7897 RepID=H3AX97_LATCH